MFRLSHHRTGRDLSLALLSLIVMAGLVLTACAPTVAPEQPTAIPAQPTAAPVQPTAAPAQPTAAPAQATEAPKPTEPPPPTEAPKPTEAPAAAAKGTVTITFTQEPDKLNPFYTNMWFSEVTDQFWLKPLWSFDDKGQVVPELVKEIPSVENGGLSADGKTITIHLRDDVTWSDGEPLTADDYVFTFQMVTAEKNTPTSRYPYADYVASVEAKDKTTFVITLKEFFAAWQTSLFNGVTSVMPKHILQPVFDKEGTIDNADWNRNPTVGIGPFVFKEWQSGSHIIFVANPKWIRPPKLEQIFIRIVPDDASQEAAIIAGDTDIGMFLDSSQIDRIEASGKAKIVANPSGYTEQWFPNVNPKTAHPAMLDPKVRLAIALATDRFTLVKDLLKADLNPVPGTFWDLTPPFADPSIKPYPYDPEKAKQLLDEAGWKVGSDGVREKVINGKTVKLKLRYITTTREIRKNVQAVVQQQWAKVGIAADLVNYASDLFFADYAGKGPGSLGEYDIMEYSNASTGYPDPEYSNRLLCSEVIIGDKINAAGVNDQGICLEELDKLLKQQGAEPDRNKRIQLYYQIEKLMYDQVLYIGIWRDPDLYSVSNRLQNVRFAGPNAYWNVDEWTVTP